MYLEQAKKGPVTAYFSGIGGVKDPYMIHHILFPTAATWYVHIRIIIRTLFPRVSPWSGITVAQSGWQYQRTDRRLSVCSACAFLQDALRCAFSDDTSNDILISSKVRKLKPCLLFGKPLYRISEFFHFFSIHMDEINDISVFFRKQILTVSRRNGLQYYDPLHTGYYRNSA